MKCSGPAFKPGANGVCQCGVGYEGQTALYAPPVCPKCPSPDMTTQIRPATNGYNACICKDSRKGLVYAAYPKPNYCACRWGFQPSGSTCTYHNFCKSKLFKIQYWVGSSLAGWDGKAFPKAVLTKAPSATASVAELSWAKLPAAGKSGKVAIRVQRCVCLVHKDWDFQAKYSISKGAKVGGGLGGDVL